MRRVQFVLPLAAYLIVPLSAAAQTAEDRVAFILFGVEDGARQNNTSLDHSRAPQLVMKTVQSTWKRESNGLHSAHIKRGEYSSTIRIAVRQLNECTYTVLVSNISDSDDRDRDDETLVTVDFSRISTIDYRTQLKETGRREFSGPLRITTTAPNAICNEQRFELVAGKARTRTTCTKEGQHLFPTATPFYGLSRAPAAQEAAVSAFRQRVCPLRTP